MKSVLITGSGCPGWYATYLSVKKWADIKDFFIIGCDIHASTPGASLVKRHYIVPKGNDINYSKEIFNIIELENIKIIIPLTDPELAPLSVVSDLLWTKYKCRVLVSDKESLQKVLNKERLYTGVSCISPKFKKYNEVKSVYDFIKDYSDGVSCFVKLISGYGSRGTKKVVSKKEWLDGFDIKKPESFGLTFPIDDLDKLENKDNLVLVETLPGKEYSIDCLFDSEGNLIFYGVRERETTRNGICYVAKFIVDKDKEFLRLIQQIQNFVSLKYNINIQVKRDREGLLKLLEINPRISGSLGSFESLNISVIGDALNFAIDKKYVSLLPNTYFEYLKEKSYRVSFFI